MKKNARLLSAPFLLLSQFCFTGICHAQLAPQPGQQLCHTEVMIEHPAVKNAVIYRIAISEYQPGKPARKVIALTDSTPATHIRSGLQFGHQYTWSYTALDAHQKVIFTSELFHFSILHSKLVDPAYQRTQLAQPCSSDCGQGIIFLDGLNIAVDRKGEPVWFMPGYAEENYRDLHLSREGTVLFMKNADILETSVDGKVLWKGPGNKGFAFKSENGYHHAFDKDAYGQYMVCGKQVMTDAQTRTNGPTLFEYDAAGKMTWQFDAVERIGQFSGAYPPADTTKTVTLGHLNGFAIDHDKQLVYASFRDFSCIAKIDHRSGSILSLWGNKRISYEQAQHSDELLFAAQHCPILLKNGNLAVFNNNAEGRSSSVMELKENPASGEAEKVWEYVFEQEPAMHAPSSFRPHSDKMGSVQELPNGNFFIAMGDVNRVLEVDRAKRTVWDLYTEARSDSTLPWSDRPNYRAFYASSLYPSYFTIECETQQAQLLLRLNNEGSEDDTYTIEWFAGGSTSALMTRTVKVSQSSSVHVPLDFQTSLKTPVQGELRVTPASNPKAVRKLSCTLRP